METCETCLKQFKDKSGLSGHVRFSHPGTVPRAIESLEALRQEVAELPEQVLLALDGLRQELLDKLEQVRQASFSHAHKAAEQEVKLLKSSESVRQLEHRVSEASLAQVDIPDLGAIIEHCEDGTCKAHAAQWYDIKKQIIQLAYDNASPKWIEKRAEELGFAPKRIIISRR